MKRITKFDVRMWDDIQKNLQALSVNSNIGRVSVVCRDGLQMDLLYPQGGRDLETLSVIVNGAPADELRNMWVQVSNPARGKFFNVPAADVIELIWKHGGVDMRASRTATKTMVREYNGTRRPADGPDTYAEIEA